MNIIRARQQGRGPQKAYVILDLKHATAEVKRAATCSTAETERLGSEAAAREDEFRADLLEQSSRLKGERAVGRNFVLITGYMYTT